MIKSQILSIILGILLIIFLVYCGICGNITTNMNVSYNVKEIHMGTEDGSIFYNIVYINNNQIKIIELQDYELPIYFTNGNARLVWKTRTKTMFGTDLGVEKDTFELYVPNNMTFTGSTNKWDTSNGKVINNHKTIVY